MPCSHCGRDIGAPTPPCPHCQDAVPALSTRPEEHPREQDAAIDPEVLPPEDAQKAPRGPLGAQDIFGQKHAQGQGQRAGGSFRFTMWHGGSTSGNGAGMGGMGMGSAGLSPNSCLPSCITLFLLLICAVQFGVLAAVGFIFFHLVGSGLVLTFNLRQLMQGRQVYPWAGRIVVWGISWGLAGWLSGSF